MLNKIKETIRKYNLINESDKIVVAVSGGPDSITLLDALYKLKYNIESAAKMYVNENKYELGFNCEGNPIEIGLSTLIDTGKISSPVINPVTNSPVSNDDVKVEVKYDCGTKNFTYKVSGIDCK